jgi:tRNA uridine 5-carboxymethylaminomethyl modification enzyme
VADDRWERFRERRARYEKNRSIVEKTTITSSGGDRIPAARALKQPDITVEGLIDRGELSLAISSRSRAIDLASIETDFKYEGYIQRQHATIDRQRRQEGRGIPSDFTFAGIPGLSREMVERLSAIRPETLGQASRIPGVTPAAISVIAAYLDRPRSRAAV